MTYTQADLDAAREPWEWQALIGKPVDELRRHMLDLLRDGAAQPYVDHAAIALLHASGTARADLDAAWRAGRDAAFHEIIMIEHATIGHKNQDAYEQAVFIAIAKSLHVTAEHIRALQPPAASKP